MLLCDHGVLFGCDLCSVREKVDQIAEVQERTARDHAASLAAMEQRQREADRQQRQQSEEAHRDAMQVAASNREVAAAIDYEAVRRDEERFERERAAAVQQQIDEARAAAKAMGVVFDEAEWHRSQKAAEAEAAQESYRLASLEAARAVYFEQRRRIVKAGGDLQTYDRRVERRADLEAKLPALQAAADESRTQSRPRAEIARAVAELVDVHEQLEEVRSLIGQVPAPVQVDGIRVPAGLEGPFKVRSQDPDRTFERVELAELGDVEGVREMMKLTAEIEWVEEGNRLFRIMADDLGDSQVDGADLVVASRMNAFASKGTGFNKEPDDLEELYDVMTETYLGRLDRGDDHDAARAAALNRGRFGVPRWFVPVIRLRDGSRYALAAPKDDFGTLVKACTERSCDALYLGERPICHPI